MCHFNNVAFLCIDTDRRRSFYFIIQIHGYWSNDYDNNLYSFITANRDFNYRILDIYYLDLFEVGESFLFGDLEREAYR